MEPLTMIENFVIVYPIINYVCEIFEIEKYSKKIGLFTTLYLTCWSIDLIDLNLIISNVCLYIIMVIWMVFSYRLFIKDKNKKYLNLFIVGNLILYYFSIRGIIISLYSIILNVPMHQIIYNENYCEISDLVTVLIFFIFFPLLKKSYSVKRVQLIPESDLKYNAIYLYIFIAMIWGSNIPYYYNIEFIWLNYYNAFNHLLCIVLNYIIFMYTYIKNERIEYKMKSNLFENQLNYNLQNYNNKAIYIEKLRTFKHDYKGIMSSAHILIENNDMVKLKSLLKEVNINFDEIENLYEEFSNNILLQAIMVSFYRKCMEKQIEFEGKIFLPETIALTDYEKCRIFHNLLNNAFEACNYNLNKGIKNYIKINTSISDSWFSITIENTFDGYLRKDNGKLLSRKEDNLEHGFGVKSVIDIVEDKNGFVNIETSNNIFKVNLNLPISQI